LLAATLAMLAGGVALADDIRVEPRAVSATVIYDGAGAAGLTAYDGYLVWSRYLPEDGVWQLMQWHDGVVSSLPVLPRSVPFDVSAGSSATGRPVVVFSRCRVEPKQLVGVMPGPRWETASGCSLYQLGLAGRPTLSRLNRIRPRLSLTTPSIYRGQIAAVQYERSGGRTRAHVLLWRRGSPRPVGLPGGSPPSCAGYAKGCSLVGSRTAVDALSLGPVSAAILWRVEGPGVTGTGTGWELRTTTLAGHRSVIVQSGYTSGACGFHQPFAPTATPGGGVTYVDWASPCEQLQTALARFRLSTLQRSEARPASTYVFGAASDRTSTYWLRGQLPGSPGATPPSTALPCVQTDRHCEIVVTRSPPYQPGRVGPGHPATF